MAKPKLPEPRAFEPPVLIECEAPRCPRCDSAEFRVYKTEPTEAFEPATRYVACLRCGKKIKIRWF